MIKWEIIVILKEKIFYRFLFIVCIYILLNLEKGK